MPRKNTVYDRHILRGSERPDAGEMLNVSVGSERFVAIIVPQRRHSAHLHLAWPANISIRINEMGLKAPENPQLPRRFADGI